MILFWPHLQYFGIWEEDYCVKFCLQKNKDFFPGELVLYKTEEEIFSSDEKEIFFISRDPKLIIVPETWSFLLKALEKRNVVVPVFNETCVPFQKKDLLYYNIETLRKAICDSQEGKVFSVSLSKVDPKFIGFKGPVLHDKAWVIRDAYVHKFQNYAEGEPQRIFLFFPSVYGRVLDVGCGKGVLGRWLKSKNIHLEIYGIEPNKFLAQKAQKYYESIFLGPFEACEIFRNDFFDFIVMADILEHLYDPWYSLSKAFLLLRRNGVLLGAVPNAGHWSIVQSLMEDHFEYLPWGLTCITHLRFFTKKLLIKSLRTAGFKQIKVWGVKHPIPQYAAPFLEKNKIQNLEIVEWVFSAQKL